MPPFDFAGDIWKTRPTPFSSVFSGKTLKSAGMGAVGGAAVGGVPGTVAGAGLAATFSILTESVRKVTVNIKQLEEVTRKFIDQYKEYSPVISRLNHQFVLLDRRLKRLWAQTLEPLLKQTAKISLEFRERWEKMKVGIFQAIEPFLKGILNMFSLTVKGMLAVFEGLTSMVTKVIDGFTALLRFLHLLPGEEEGPGPTQKLKGFPIEWPTVEGPLTGAMKRTALTGPPFTDEFTPEKKSRRRGGEEKEPDEIRNKISEVFPEGLPTGFGVTDYIPPKTKKEKKTGQSSDINIEVNVQDSKELTAAFERAWREATYELHKIEAEELYRSLVLQQQRVYT